MMRHIGWWLIYFVSATLVAFTVLAMINHARAGQQTIYSNDGNVVGRYTTDSQGTTTLYGRDGRVISRSTGPAIIMHDGVGGTIIPDRRDGKSKRK
jgi:hypothetical protein